MGDRRPDPGVIVDRINVGGNESGQQSTFRGPGVSDDENAFLVDGVEITDMAAVGASSTYFDFDQFTEMQFTTGGTDVTKSTAGVSVNLVTKRGTNEFRGSARFLRTQDDFFNGALGAGRRRSSSSRTAGSATARAASSATASTRSRSTASRPVVRSCATALWFWGSFGQNDIKNLTGGASPADVQADDTILENTAFKFNAQISAPNSFVGSWNNGDKKKFGRNAGPTRPQPTTWDQRGPSAIFKFEDTHVFSSNFFLGGSYSKVDGGFSLTSEGLSSRPAVLPMPPRRPGMLTVSGRTATASGASSSPVDGVQDRRLVLLQHRQFLARVEVRRSSARASRPRVPSTGLVVTSSRSTVVSGTVWTRRRWLSSPNAVRTRLRPPQEYASLWVQDTMQFGKFTVNAGFRYDAPEWRERSLRSSWQPGLPDPAASDSIRAVDDAGTSTGAPSPHASV